MRLYVVAHCQKNQPGETIGVYRSMPHASFKGALKKARRIAKNGYYAWIESRMRMATR